MVTQSKSRKYKMVPIDFLGWPFSTDLFWIGDHISLTSFGLGNQFSLTHFGLVPTFHWHVLDWVTTFHWRLLREIWDKKLNLRVKSSSDELKSMLFLVLELHSMIYVKIVGADTIPLSTSAKSKYKLLQNWDRFYILILLSLTVFFSFHGFVMGLCLWLFENISAS